MFNISSKAKQKLNEGEISALLKNYTLVPPDAWYNIPLQTHVRYFKKDGTFVRGGFLMSYDKNGGGFAHVSNNLFEKAANYKIWPVNFSKVEKIYAKTQVQPPARPAASLSAPNTPRAKPDLEKKIADIITHVNKLTSLVNDQKLRIEALEKRR